MGAPVVCQYYSARIALSDPIAKKDKTFQFFGSWKV